MTFLCVALIVARPTVRPYGLFLVPAPRSITVSKLTPHGNATGLRQAKARSYDPGGRVAGLERPGRQGAGSPILYVLPVLVPLGSSQANNNHLRTDSDAEDSSHMSFAMAVQGAVEQITLVNTAWVLMYGASPDVIKWRLDQRA
ncbi:hypothetical protein LTR49_024392 [Elasticomyces elasticus]|nr:hypothetical protein LTR49_024392 [Elasticomyces elasticus]KAK5745080.1 hypothetical protein LTS12_023234 [Elasticomyces elasticus]